MEDRGAEGKVSLFPEKIPRTPHAIHDVAAGLLPHCMRVVSAAHALGAQGALGPWRDQPWHLSPLHGARPLADLSRGVGDPSPSLAGPSGAAWRQARAP